MVLTSLLAPPPSAFQVFLSVLQSAAAPFFQVFLSVLQSGAAPFFSAAAVGNTCGTRPKPDSGFLQSRLWLFFGQTLAKARLWLWPRIGEDW